MQRIERYGVLALVFLLVTLVTFALWDDESKPGNEEVAKAAPAEEAPVRRLSPAERQQREALRRREAANRELERRKTQDAAKGLSPKEKYQQGKSAAELAEEQRRRAERGFAKTDKPAVDGSKPSGYQLQIGDGSTGRSGRDAGPRGGNAPADLDVSPDNNSRRETAADKNRRAREEMDRLRRQGEHVVAKGETLSQISVERLGTTRRMQEIVALNPGINPDLLVVGQKLILPGGGTPAPNGRAGVGVAPKSSPQPVGPGGSYTIQSGDVLSRIAQDQLGSVKYVQAILDANPGLEPTQLSVGQVIAMPAGVKLNSVATAPRRSTSSTASDRPRVR